MLKRQKVQDAIQVLPQPGLQAEEIDVEVSRMNTLGRLPEGVSLRGTETRVIKTPAHQAHLGEEQRGWISWWPHSKTQPVWSLHGSHLTPQEGLVPCLGTQPPPSPASHLEEPVSPLKENRAPRLSCRERRGKRRCHPWQHASIPSVCWRPQSFSPGAEERASYLCRDAHRQASRCTGTGLSLSH